MTKYFYDIRRTKVENYQISIRRCLKIQVIRISFLTLQSIYLLEFYLSNRPAGMIFTILLQAFFILTI